MTQTQTPPVDQAQWHYMIGQQQLGPVPMSTIVGMINTGSITASTLVWKQGMAGWIPAGSAPEFTYVFQTRPTPVNEVFTSKKEAAMGLTTAGLILFIVLLFVCLPLCWLPWVIDSTRAKS